MNEHIAIIGNFLDFRSLEILAQWFRAALDLATFEKHLQSLSRSSCVIGSFCDKSFVASVARTAMIQARKCVSSRPHATISVPKAW